MSGIRLMLLVPILLGATGLAVAQDESVPILEVLQQEADALRPLCESDLGRRFLAMVSVLPLPQDRTVLYNKSTRDAMTLNQAEGLSAEHLEGYEQETLDAEFYYTTKYGSPLAFVRALDLVGQAGLASLNGKRIADFGFGSIGQLRIMASMGAHVVGVDVDALLEALYSRPQDTGNVQPMATSIHPGLVELAFGQFPLEEDVVKTVGRGCALFVSKNTLKNGYIHPAQEVDPRMLVDLGVDDATFVQHVYDALEPGGYFMIYNLCPPQSEERYIPWADGRSPFSRELFEETGFEILAFDVNDDDFAREMGKALGWDKSMNLEKDLFGIYTLVQKK